MGSSSSRRLDLIRVIRVIRGRLDLARWARVKARVKRREGQARVGRGESNNAVKAK